MIFNYLIFQFLVEFESVYLSSWQLNLILINSKYSAKINYHLYQNQYHFLNYYQNFNYFSPLYSIFLKTPWRLFLLVCLLKSSHQYPIINVHLNYYLNLLYMTSFYFKIKSYYPTILFLFHFRFQHECHYAIALVNLFIMH